MDKFKIRDWKNIGKFIEYGMLPEGYEKGFEACKKVSLQERINKLLAEGFSELSMSSHIERIKDLQLFERGTGALYGIGKDGYIQRVALSFGCHSGGFVPFDVYEDEENIYIRRNPLIKPGKCVEKSDAGRAIIEKYDYLAWSDDFR